MSARAILALYLAFFILELGWDVFLTLLNLRHARRHAGAVDDGTYARAISYTLARGKLGLLAGAVSSAALLAAVLTGFLGIVDAGMRLLPVHRYFQGILFIACLSLLSWLIGLPFSLYSTFSLEARFGFNRVTPPLFVVDALKGLAVSAVIAVPVLLGLFWFMDAAGDLWWVWAFAAMSGFQIVMSALYPVAIAPLFNRFTPLPEGPLREAILGLAARLGFRAKGVFVMDGSRRSRHSNAYFTGLGKAKRIVLFDTLVESVDQAEILSVLAHEIGHARRHHLRKGLAVSLAVSLAGFWIAGLLLRWPPLFQAFGFLGASPHALLVLLAFCAGPFTFFLTPLSSMWSRRHEYEADRFAVDAMGSARGMRSALLRLSRDNLSNPAPHPLYSFFHYSHPTLAERIAALEAREARTGDARRDSPTDE
jgi:STE24 endopeptidase